jgi:hypothetical protein
MAKQQPAPKQKEQPAKPANTPSKPIELTPLIPDNIAKWAFLGVAAVLLIIMVSVSKQYGISGDENFHRMYGHHIVNFYATLGKDTTAATQNGADSLMIFYGGLYDGTATLLSKAVPSVDEWDVRHFWNSMFGWFAMVCAGLVAVEILGWQAGLITLLFMAFSPRFFGESMNNPKDITMAAGYMLTYVFILRFLKKLPNPDWKISVGLGLAIGVAMGIRIGGLLLIPYAYLFYGLAMWMLLGSEVFNFGKFKENIWPSFKWLLLSTVIAYFSSLIFWPYGLVAPFSHPLEALKVMSKFPVTISILFDGQKIQSTEVPWNYIPQWLLISTPLFGLLGLVASVALIPYFRQKKMLLMLGFIYFTLVFPLAYVIYKKSVLYDTMRHFFFVYPSIIILSGLVFSYFMSSLPKPGKFAVAGLAVLLIALPARFMFANHPNQYVYFNELQGGIKGAYGKYETDYYMNSVKQCAEWLKKNRDLKKAPATGGKYRLFSNAVAPCNFYFMEDSATVAIGYVSYRARTNKDGEYYILYNRFVDRELLVNNAFPPEQAIYTVYADGVPLSCVIEKKDHGDVLGLEALNNNDYAKAYELLSAYDKKYPKNENVTMYLGLACLQTGKIQEGIGALTRCIQLNSDNMQALDFLAKAYNAIGDNSNAQYIMGIMQRKQQEAQEAAMRSQQRMEGN